MGELDQATADVILARGPKEGRATIAAELEIPASWVWIVRSVAGLTQVDENAVERCRAYLKKRGVKVRKVRAVR